MAGFAAHVECGIRLPLAATFKPWVWRLRQRFWSFSPQVGLGAETYCRTDVVVTLDAVADRGRIGRASDLGGVVIGVAGQAERLRRCGNELDARDVLGYADFMATRTAGRDRRVEVLSFGFILVTLCALGRVSILIQRYGSDARRRTVPCRREKPIPQYSRALWSQPTSNPYVHKCTTNAATEGNPATIRSRA